VCGVLFKKKVGEERGWGVGGGGGGGGERDTERKGAGLSRETVLCCSKEGEAQDGRDQNIVFQVAVSFL